MTTPGNHPAARVAAMIPRRPVAVTKWVTVADVARYLGVSKMTVYRLIHAGEIPAIAVGRSYRIRESVLMNFIEGAAVVDPSEGL